MTPQFYARYIPPPSNANVPKNVDGMEESSPAEKRRKKINGDVKNADTKYEAATPRVRKSKPKVPKSDLPLAELAQNMNSTRTKLKEVLMGDSKEESAKASLLKGNYSRPLDTDGRRSISVGDENQVHTEPLDDAPKKKKKKKKHQREDGKAINGEVAPEHNLAAANAQATDHAKHGKVLSKYEKSIQSAAKIKKTVDSQTPSDVKQATPPETHGLVPLPQPPQMPEAPPPSAFSALPSWLTNAVAASTSDTLPFDSLSLNPAVMEALKAKGFIEAFAIQAAVLPLLLPGERHHHGDLCIAASTGSGKTLAYALPMIEALRDKPVTRLRGLVVVPTRELVNQARETLELCSTGSEVQIGTASGSKPLREEQESLISKEQRYDPDTYEQEQKRHVDEDEELLNWDEDQFDALTTLEEKLVGYVDDYHSNIDVLVCTPGRLIEHIQHTRGFTLNHVQWLIIDEADRLLDESFQLWTDTVMPALECQDTPDTLESLMLQKFHLLRKREVRKIILSATMTRNVGKLKGLHLQRPKLVLLQGDRGLEQDCLQGNDKAMDMEAGEKIELPSTLHEIAVQIKDEENKPLYLIELLKNLSSTRSHNPWSQGNDATNDMEEDVHGDESDNDDSSDHDPMSEVTSSSGSSSPSARDSPSFSDSDVSMRDYQPKSTMETTRGSLIFTHSTSSAHRLSRLLSILAPPQASVAAVLTKSSSKSSERILSRFRNGKLHTVISTDRTSRGLDIPDLAQVINYDMPSSVNNYVHRVGRTARAGKAGTAITLFGWREGRWFWNEIGRGQAVSRGGRKIVRKRLREEGWTEKEREEYSDALKKLGREAREEEE
ncbi:MAG: hypothetical protein Q9166_007211 [cf. Caloplaca sp. 2 TL-2023]